MKKILSTILFVCFLSSQTFAYDLSYNEKHKGYVVSYKETVLPKFTIDCHGRYPKDIETASSRVAEREDLLNRYYAETIKTLDNTIEIPALAAIILFPIGIAGSIALTFAGGFISLPFALFESKESKAKREKYAQDQIKMLRDVANLIEQTCPD